MGLVNLSILVEKLKKKLSGDFVSKTDYASTSSAGVIKLDNTYATDITTGGKLKAKEISASDYASANDNAFVSKGTLDNLITAGAIGGGMTWTKIFDGTATQGETMPFVSGTDAFDHKILFVQSLSGADGPGFAMVGLEVVPDTTTSLKVALNRYDDRPVLTFTSTGFTMPNNMGSSPMIIYVLD